ncbi:hypothetical protein, partial [Pedobacter sp.]
RANAFQNLTIDESAEGTRVFVNTYTPSKKWIANWRTGKTEKFEGDIDVVYLNTGLPLKNSTTNKAGTTNTTIKYAMPAEDCTTTTYYEYLPYYCASGNHGPDDAGCYLTGNDAAGYYVFDYTVTNCNGGGGGGAGGSTTPNPDPGFNPCDSGNPDPGAGVASTNKKSTGNKVMIAAPPTDCDPLPKDCAGVPGGSAYIDPNCNTCIGGTTGIESCNNLNIDIDLLTRLNYPILGKIIDNLYSKVKNDTKLLNALIQYTHMSRESVLNNLKLGSGPKLVVVENFPQQKIGEYKDNTIYINKNTIQQTNYIYKDFSTALEFYITVVILHEFVHFGENKMQIFLPHNGNTDDAGFQFENNMYGGKVFFNVITGIIEYEKL